MLFPKVIWLRSLGYVWSHCRSWVVRLQFIIHTLSNLETLLPSEQIQGFINGRGETQINEQTQCHPITYSHRNAVLIGSLSRTISDDIGKTILARFYTIPIKNTYDHQCPFLCAVSISESFLQFELVLWCLPYFYFLINSYFCILDIFIYYNYYVSPLSFSKN